MAYKNDGRITIRIPTEMARQLKQLCISMSKQEGKVIGISEFIRDLIKPFIKVEKQGDMFKKNKK